MKPDRLCWGLPSTSIGGLLRAACQCGTIAVLASLGSPEIVGQYALGIAVSAPLLVLALFRRREPGAADIRITSLALALLGIAAAGFLQHSVQDRLAVVLVVSAECVEWVADFYAGRRGVFSLALHDILPIAVLGAILTRTGHLGIALLAVLIVRLLALFFYDFRTTRRERPAKDRESHVARLAGMVPCYFVAHMLGYRALGIFAAMASLLPAANICVLALAEAATAQLTAFYGSGERPGFRRMCVQMVGAGLMLGLCGVTCAMIAGPRLLDALFGSEYAAQPALFVALCAAAGVAFVATMLNSTLVAGRRANQRMAIEIVSIAATSLACVVLISRAGLPGVACALGAGSLVQVALQLCVLRSILRRPRHLALLALLNAPLAP